MQQARLFEIVYLLMERSPRTADDLARRMEVSSRTIRRDIDALSAAGVPVYMARGKGGGVHLMDGYVLNKSLISDQEKDDILAALSALQTTGAMESKDTSERLARLFQRESSDWLDIDFSFWGAPPEYKQAFETIRQAICTRHLLRFCYYDASGNQTERTVEAVKLVFKESNWYLQAFCLKRNGWRVFKLFRMDWRTMRVLDDAFEPRTPPEAFGQTGLTGATRLVLLFEKNAEHRVREEFAPECITFQDDGRLLVTLDSKLDERTRFYLLSFGAGLEVVEPNELREWMSNQAREISETYGSRSKSNL